MNDIAEGAPVQKLSARIRSLAPKYLEQRNLEVRSMEDLLMRGDFEQVVFFAHKMNGSATGYGFPELSILAAQLEEAAERKDKQLAQTHTLALLQAMERLRAAL
jgi:HPt (histidine-containing phosphotransfer) domain-containing protein